MSVITLTTCSQEAIDSNFVTQLNDQIHVRYFLSRKFTNVNISENGRSTLNYEPNSSVNLGVGVTLKSISVNLAYGFKFLNEDEGKGKTDYFDFQANVYKRKYVIDAFAQSYNGFFLNNKSLLPNQFGQAYYLRPDLQARLFGVSYLRVFNHKKFSYAAPFVQNEIQKKSAGTFLFGAKSFWARLESDSSLVPYFVADSIYGEIAQSAYLKSFQFGPTAGYAYSLVLAKRLFISATLNLSFMIGPVEERKFSNVKLNNWQVNPVFGLRAAIGYNSPKRFLGITLLQEGTTLRSKDNVGEANIGGGSVRLVYVTRFTMKKQFRERLDKLL